MKSGRSALPLPRYALRKPLKGGWGYFFNIPTWTRKKGCTVSNLPLGTNYDMAVRRAEQVLLSAFDSWRTGGKLDGAITIHAVEQQDESAGKALAVTP
jgi:hypothetical protein